MDNPIYRNLYELIKSYYVNITYFPNVTVPRLFVNEMAMHLQIKVRILHPNKLL